MSTHIQHSHLLLNDCDTNCPVSTPIQKKRDFITIYWHPHEVLMSELATVHAKLLSKLEPVAVFLYMKPTWHLPAVNFETACCCENMIVVCF